MRAVFIIFGVLCGLGGVGAWLGSKSAIHEGVGALLLLLAVVQIATATLMDVIITAKTEILKSLQDLRATVNAVPAARQEDFLQAASEQRDVLLEKIERTNQLLEWLGTKDGGGAAAGATERRND